MISPGWRTCSGVHLVLLRLRSANGAALAAVANRATAWTRSIVNGKEGFETKAAKDGNTPLCFVIFGGYLTL
jgi:hypothetical protein